MDRELTQTQIQDMRDWIGECAWGDLDVDDIDDLSDRQVVGGIERHYAGGVDAFLADSVQS